MKKTNKHKNLKIVQALVIISVLFTLIFFAACDRRDPDTLIITDLTTVDQKTTLYVADNNAGITLVATVKDNNNFFRSDVEVKFKSSVNEVLRFAYPSVMSDSTGIAFATVYVRENALQGIVSADLELDVIVGAYLGDKKQKEIVLKIRETPILDHIELRPTSLPGSVPQNQRIQIQARPILPDSGENARRLVDGLQVTFVATKGRFVDGDGLPSSVVTVMNGFATTFWESGLVVGEAAITAKIGQFAKSDTLETVITAGTARNISFEVVPDSVRVNEAHERIIVQVTDQYGNPVKSGIVNFTSLKNDDTPMGGVLSPRLTDMNGLAWTEFSPGSIAGVAIVTATCGDSASANTMITIYGGEPNSMRWVSDEAINLTVQGSGGQEAVTIGVKVYDMSDNLVTEPTYVEFVVMRAPQGVKIEGLPWASTTKVEKVTTGGIASISISSGTETGAVLLSAQLMKTPTPNPTYYSPPRQLSRTNVLIHSGTPVRYSMVFPDFAASAGRAIGSGLWEVKVGALITDRLGNPIAPGTGVVFGVKNLRTADVVSGNLQYVITNGQTPIYPDGSVKISPDSVSIFAPAFVGNKSVDGDSTAGMAWTTMIYHGRLSLQWVDVTLKVGNEDPYEEPHQLRLNTPVIDIQAYPQLICYGLTLPAPVPPGYFGGGGNVEGYTTVWVKVTDGQQNDVMNVPLYFTTDRGYFKDSNATMNLFEVPTEAQVDGRLNPETMVAFTENSPFLAPTDKQGLQKKRFFSHTSMFLMPPDGSPGIITSSITVQILGFPNTATILQLNQERWQ